MSVFIASMPSAGLIEMPPVSNVTPLPTSASVPLARVPAGGSYVTFTNRGGRVEPWPTPSTPPIFCVLIWGSVSMVTLTPLPVRSFFAAAANSAGDFVPDGSFTMSRAQPTASATMHASSIAAVTAFPRPPTRTAFASFVALPFVLYARNWYAPSSSPSVTARAASASSSAGAALVSVVATVVTFMARRATAAAARRSVVALTSSGSPTPTRSAAPAPRPSTGTRSVSPGLPLNPASTMKVSSRPPRASSTASAPTPSVRSAPTGTASTPAFTDPGACAVALTFMLTAAAPHVLDAYLEAAERPPDTHQRVFVRTGRKAPSCQRASV